MIFPVMTPFGTSVGTTVGAVVDRSEGAAEGGIVGALYPGDPACAHTRTGNAANKRLKKSNAATFIDNFIPIPLFFYAINDRAAGWAKTIIQVDGMITFWTN
jgi:hypothetical protein